MNADLTINSIVLKKLYDDAKGSVRQSTTRGINTPDVLTISNEPYVDSATKVAGRRYLVRLDRVDIDETTGQKRTASAYFVIAVPSTSSTEISTLVETFRDAVAESNFIEAVLNGER